MPTYISLINYTREGIINMKDSPARLAKAKEVFKAAGCELKAFYLTVGHYDAVAIAEGPSDEAMAKCLLTVAGTGAIRTESLRAFSEAEYLKIIAALP